MNTSEVLDRAADLIQERGWKTGASGWPGADATSPLCLEGGIMAALGVRLFTEEFFTCPAYRAVQSYLGLSHETHVGELGMKGPVDPLWNWNDGLAGSARRVVEVLRAAAMVERTREAAVVAVSS